MAERAEMWVSETEVPFRIDALRGQAIGRMKSWLAGHADGSMPVLFNGLALPSNVGAMLCGGPVRVLCIGPGDWMIVSREWSGSRLGAELTRHAPQEGLAVFDLNDGFIGLDTRGSAVREVLSKGCGLDLHPLYFGPGQCARTRFAQIPLIIACVAEPSIFELYVPRSYFDYLHSWLMDAAAELVGPGPHFITSFSAH